MEVVGDQKLGDQIICVYELSNLMIDSFKQMVFESGRRKSAEYSSSSKQLQTLMGREIYVAETGQKDHGSFSCGRRIKGLTSRLRGARDLYRKSLPNDDTKLGRYS